MVRLVVCYIAEDENNWIFKASLQSSLLIADKVLIIDSISQDGTLQMVHETAEKLGMGDKIEVVPCIYRHEYIGANGLQRNQYLKWLKKLPKEEDWWCLVLDADEVLSDNSFKIKDIIKSNPFEIYNIKMEHFIWHLGLVDNTLPEHYVNYRLFKVTDKLFYDEVEHPLLKGFDLPKLGQTNEFTIFHFGYIKGALDVIKKYNNHVRKSNIHNKEFLDRWRSWHILGTYPVRPFTDFASLPSTVKKEIGIS
jgi:hypothetical protein